MREVRKEGSPYPKADLTLRGLARTVDLLVAASLALAAPQIGAVLGALYLLLADGLLNGQSLGKRIFGVRAVVLPETPLGRARPAGHRESALRNAPFALVLLFYGVPFLWLLLFVCGVPIVAFESYMVWTDRLGLRIGDVFADTQVVDAKVVIQSGELATDGLEAATAAPPGPSASAVRHAGRGRLLAA